jgi:hypothetical protein
MKNEIENKKKVDFFTGLSLSLYTTAADWRLLEVIWCVFGGECGWSCVFVVVSNFV